MQKQEKAEADNLSIEKMSAFNFMIGIKVQFDLTKLHAMRAT